MIISTKYGKSLVKRGKAREEGTVSDNYIIGKWYMILSRYDIARTDHYVIPARK